MALYFVVANRYILSTENIAFFDQSENIEQAYATIKWPNDKKNKIRIIYFWQAYCPCDVRVIPHFKELIKEHGEKSIEFYLADVSPTNHPNVSVSQASYKAPSYSRPLDTILESHLTELFRPFVSHTPSVAIWNENNELTYFGPHNLGYVCNAETSFVKKVIDSLLEGIQSKNTNIVGKGCFCKVKE